jgi:L-lactate utilization protein LutB
LCEENTLDGNEPNVAARRALLAEKVITAMKDRNIEAFYRAASAEAVELAVSLIPPDATVSWGGSITLNEIGLLGAVRRGGFKVIDRDTAPDAAARFEMQRQALTCDVYLTSVNAISEDGQMVNMDGIGNRVAAMAFGPKRVIVVAGMNKVCRTVEDAVARARGFASPVNAQRVGAKKTPCAVTGSCADCRSEDCICSYVVTTRMSRIPDRMKVVLVGRSLGF